MANEKGRNKSKREQKKIERLKRLLGIDLCSCGPADQLRCQGVCRKAHMNFNKIECKEVYQIEYSDIKSNKPRRPRRTWKYGQQKEGDENRRTKQERREKMRRDQTD